MSPCSTTRPVPPLRRRPISGKASAPLEKSSEPLPEIFVPLISTVRSLRTVPAMLRTSLPSSGAKGAISIEPVKATVPASGAVGLPCP